MVYVSRACHVVCRAAASHSSSCKGSEKILYAQGKVVFFCFVAYGGQCMEVRLS